MRIRIALACAAVAAIAALAETPRTFTDGNVTVKLLQKGESLMPTIHVKGKTEADTAHVTLFYMLRSNVDVSALLPWTKPKDLYWSKTTICPVVDEKKVGMGGCDAVKLAASEVLEVRVVLLKTLKDVRIKPPKQRPPAGD